MDLGISGENALLIGGTQGLALACAWALSEAGVRLVINGRDAERGEAPVSSRATYRTRTRGGASPTRRRRSAARFRS